HRMSIYYPRRPEPVRTPWLLVALPVLALLLGVGLVLAWRFGPALIGRSSDNAPVALRPVKVRPGLYENEKTVIEMYKRVKPSVVNATSLPVRRDFSRNIHRIPKGSGSGFVWDKQGHIVTNYHVIEDANAAVVTLDGVQYQAQLVGYSRNDDL